MKKRERKEDNNDQPKEEPQPEWFERIANDPRTLHIEAYQSPIRAMMAHVHGTGYVPLRTLEEAKQFPDGRVILEGDSGGQIYLVASAHDVICTEAVLRQLLDDLNHIAWNGYLGEGLYFERLPVGAGVAGGMGGAEVTESVWIHNEFQRKGIADFIVEVLTAKRARLPKRVVVYKQI